MRCGRVGESLADGILLFLRDLVCVFFVIALVLVERLALGPCRFRAFRRHGQPEWRLRKMVGRKAGILEVKFPVTKKIKQFKMLVQGFFSIETYSSTFK